MVSSSRREFIPDVYDRTQYQLMRAHPSVLYGHQQVYCLGSRLEMPSSTPGRSLIEQR